MTTKSLTNTVHTTRTRARRALGSDQYDRAVGARSKLRSAPTGRATSKSPAPASCPTRSYQPYPSRARGVRTTSRRASCESRAHPAAAARRVIGSLDPFSVPTAAGFISYALPRPRAMNGAFAWVAHGGLALEGCSMPCLPRWFASEPGSPEPKTTRWPGPGKTPISCVSSEPGWLKRVVRSCGLPGAIRATSSHDATPTTGECRGTQGREHDERLRPLLPDAVLDLIGHVSGMARPGPPLCTPRPGPGTRAAPPRRAGAGGRGRTSGRRP
jgi:hypothetical protein